MNRSPVLDYIEEQPVKRPSWTRAVLLALLLSLVLHGAFVWWARRFEVNTFSDAYYDRIVPRAFKVDRVEIDSRLLDEDPVPAAEERQKTPQAPVELPPEDISAEKPPVPEAPPKPAALAIGNEPLPEPGGAALDAAIQPRGATAEAFDEDLDAMRKALLAEAPSSAAQPALELASSAGRSGSGADDAVPAGYSDLDTLLAQTGGVTESQAPIFMPSDVLFGYDESFLRPEAIVSLEKLAELIRRSPESRFRIEGHTDSFGGEDYNRRLSLARAKSVKQWLAGTMGIDAARIDTRGLGATRPLVSVDGTIEEQKLNRRVEIVILRAGGAR